MSGLRISFSPGNFGPWGYALRNLLDVKKVPYTLAMHPQMAGGPGDLPGQAPTQDQGFLYALTKQRSVPTMLYNEEPPRNSWVEQVRLADRLGAGPSLIPADPKDRVLMFGLLHEICAEEGIMWAKRLTVGETPLTRKYGWSKEAESRAPRRMVEGLTLMVEQLAKQRARGQTTFLVGDALTIVDIYLASMSVYFGMPAGPDLIPRTKQNPFNVRGMYAEVPEVKAFVAAHPELLEWRDRILKTYCITPARLGGDPDPDAPL